MSTVNQKEYLKRYLTKNKDKKKKKKKVPKGIAQSRVKIIDDNIDVHEQIQTIQDIENDTEDAPQVVSVIDDRPVELRLDNFNDSSKWTTVDIKHQIKEEPESPNRNGDSSPPRRERDDKSPTRRRKDNSDADESPPRRRRNYDLDGSPPRKDRSHREDSIKRSKNDDYSPPRRSRHDSSPPRRPRVDKSPQRNNRRRSTDRSSPRKTHRRMSNDSDKSLPRRARHNEIFSRLVKNEDSSPPRKSKREDSSQKQRDKDESPSKRRKLDQSPPKNRKRDNSLSQSRNSNKKSRWASKSPSPPPAKPSTSKSTKATKTLDGKTAGLQNAKDLVEETANFRKREAKLFEQMSSEVSGANASTVMRDRKTGKIRNLEAEAEEKSVQKERSNELQKKYDQWGKGVKQTADYQQKLEDAAHEMSKPLARYADDADLERHLKEQERAGDPMLAYIKKKKRDDAVKAGVQLKPEYMGEFMPNRYGIRPGHRWDGVDRSNGYEKKWFDAINQRNADREEAYRWNSEDM